MVASPFTRALLSAVVVGGCGKPPTVVPADFSVEFIRTGCMGHCPVYGVSLAPTGIVTLDARQHVRGGLPSTWTLPHARRRDLFDLLRGKLSTVGMQERVNAACHQWWSDNPTFSVSTTMDGSTHVLRFSYGCRPAWWAVRDQAHLSEVKARADDIDVLLGTSQIACDQSCTELF